MINFLGMQGFALLALMLIAVGYLFGYAIACLKADIRNKVAEGGEMNRLERIIIKL